jgi:hypothetical protein
MFDLDFVLKNETFFIDLKIKPLKIKYEMLNSYIQNIENKLAEQNNRKPSVVKIDIIPNNIIPTNPSYNYETNQIKIQYNDNISPTEFLLSIAHESEHANQTFSPFKTTQQKKLYKISDLLYIHPPENRNEMPLQYCCNYKELEAKMIEMEILLNLYKEVKMQNDVLSLSDGKKYMQLFNGMNNYINALTPKNIHKIMRNNIIRIISGNFNIEIPHPPKNEMLKFLISKAPKLYKEIIEKITPMIKEISQIHKELNDAYNIHLPNTIEKLNEIKKQEQYKKERQYNEIINVSKFSDDIEYDETYQLENIYDIDNLERRINELEKNENISKIYIIGILDEDKYQIHYNMLPKFKIGDEVLLDNEEVKLSNSNKVIDSICQIR